MAGQTKEIVCRAVKYEIRQNQRPKNIRALILSERKTKFVPANRLKGYVMHPFLAGLSVSYF